MSVYVSAELRRRIRAHFRDHCAYCRTPESLTVVIFEFEHILPRSLGGATSFENLCLSCPTCNRYVKIMLQHKDGALDPVADDVATLGLDLLLRDGDMRRGAVDPFLLGY